MDIESTPSALKEAVVICTRNRPDDLRRTIDSIVGQELVPSLLLVVDASNPNIRQINRTTLGQFPHARTYLPYTDSPSLTRQRNRAIDHLPPSVELVFFLDDDVTLLPEYFARLTDLFAVYPDIAGAGARLVESSSSAVPLFRRFICYLFLLDHPFPGRLLLSGKASSPHQTSATTPYRVDWLGGFCATYRRSILDKERFDARLDGYALFEDLDFSYRVGEVYPLLVEPKAQLIHHVSPVNRYNAERVAYERVTHRYWFVEKNICHPLRKPAFWWATLGQTLAMLTSSKPEKWDALHGLWRGIRAVWRRDHPLLKRTE